MGPTLRRIYDVSLPVINEGLSFPGDPQIHISVHQSIARGDAANVSALAFGSHTGTHIDAPRHFLPGGGPVDAVPLERLIGPAVVLGVPEHAMSIGAAELRAPGSWRRATCPLPDPQLGPALEPAVHA
jgi:kynurenine formamidase